MFYLKLFFGRQRLIQKTTSPPCIAATLPSLKIQQTNILSKWFPSQSFAAFEISRGLVEREDVTPSSGSAFQTRGVEQLREAAGAALVPPRGGVLIKDKNDAIGKSQSVSSGWKSHSVSSGWQGRLVSLRAGVEPGQADRLEQCGGEGRGVAFTQRKYSSKKKKNELF